MIDVGFSYAEAKTMINHWERSPSLMVDYGIFHGSSAVKTENANSAEA
jgi:hypothetical protein